MVSLFSPAKLNLFLTVTGRRADGFHDLVSVAAPLEFGDELEVDDREAGAGSRFTLECDDPAVPVDETNLILKAAAAFAQATGWTGAAHFRLTKHIPVGAGLGGGSSNGIAALRALQKLSGLAPAAAELAGIAAALGSDCALFLHDRPVVMRGRGERVDPLPPSAAARVRGRRVLVFKPGFGISTPWAYGRMIARGTDYLPPAEAEARLARWLAGDAPVETLCFNNMEPAAFEKHLALPVLLARLQRDFGLVARMSGSGSACFAVLRDDFVTTPVIAAIRDAWGPRALVQETRLAGPGSA